MEMIPCQIFASLKRAKSIEIYPQPSRPDNLQAGWKNCSSPCSLTS